MQFRLRTLLLVLALIGVWSAVILGLRLLLDDTLFHLSFVVCIALTLGSGWLLLSKSQTESNDHSRFRFTIRDVLWTMAVIGLASGWFADGRKSRAAIDHYRNKSEAAQTAVVRLDHELKPARKAAPP